MRVLVAGGAGFIGSTYVRGRLAAHPDDSVRVLDKLTYAGRRENLDGAPRREARAGGGGHRRPRGRCGGGRGLRRDRQLRRRVARRPLDRVARASSSRPTSSVPSCCSRRPAPPGSATSRSRPTRSTGRSSPGSFTERSPLEPSSPYSASKAGGDLIVGAYRNTYGADALIVRGSNNYGPRQHPEKLIPLCILNALAGDPLPVYGDGMQVRNWIFVEDFCSGIDLVLERGEAGQAYNVGGPDELPNIEVVRTILTLTGRDESLIEYVTDRLGHDRRYSLSSVEDPRARLGAAGEVPRRAAPDGRVVPRERVVVGADPQRRVPRVLRAPVRPSLAGLMARRLDTELEGWSLIEPEVHGDERGFLVETFRDDAWRELGVGVDFVQENHSRSGARHPSRPPLPDRPRTGEAGPLPAGPDLGRGRRPAA